MMVEVERLLCNSGKVNRLRDDEPKKTGKEDGRRKGNFRVDNELMRSGVEYQGGKESERRECT